MPDLLFTDVLLIVIRGLLLAWLIGAAILVAEKLSRKESIPPGEFVLDAIMGGVFAFSMGWLS